MKPRLLNKGEIINTVNTLKKLEYNLQLNNIDDCELYCAVEKLVAYFLCMDK